MKKTSKSILCLLFALLFVFQIIGVCGTDAFADEDDEEKEPASVSIKVDGNDYTAPVTKSKLEGGIEFIPSDGAYVASISINGVGVTGYAIADGRSLSIDSDAVADIFEDETLSKDEDTFSISAEAAEMDEGYPKNLTAPSEDEAEVPEGREFSCWKYCYENGSIALLEPGEEFSAFMDGEFSAITHKVEAEEPEEEPEGEPEEEPLDEMPPLMTPLMGPLGSSPKYVITITPNSGSMVYTGQPADAPAADAFTFTATLGGASVDISKMTVSDISLSYQEGTITFPGSYHIVADASAASATFDGSDVEAVFNTDAVGTFEIKKVDVTVKAKAVSKDYDGEILPGAVEASGLLGTHNIVAEEGALAFIDEQAAPCDKTYKLDTAKTDKSKIKVIKDDDTDVSALYNISLSDENASYKINAASEKIKVTFSPEDINAGYTGNPVEGTMKLSSGSLPEGFVVTCEFKYRDSSSELSSAPIDQGDYKYSIKEGSVKILDGTNDVTDQYKITVKGEAKIKITKPTIVISVDDAEKVFDGKPLEPATFTQTGTLLSGHTITVTMKGSLTNVGTDNDGGDVDTVVIKDASDKDVTKLYNIDKVPGKLTVKPYAFTIEAGTVTKTFDGKPHSCNEYKVIQAVKDYFTANGWTLNVSVSGSRTEVGGKNAGDNRVTNWQVKDSSSKVIDPSNFKVTLKNGDIIIEPDASKETVTITVKSKSKTYDGSALLLEAKDYTISAAELHGYTIEVTLPKASLTNAGQKTVTVESYKIKDKNGNVVALEDSPFNIAIKEGTLQVKKRPVTITAKSGTKTYDGKEFVLNSVTITIDGNSFPSGQKAEIKCEAQDGDGVTVKAIKPGKYYNVVTEVFIYDDDGTTDVTNNYDIKLVNGTLTIKNSNGNPQTGDTSNISLWATILAVSAVAVVCIVVIVLVRSKKKAD